ncbi:cytochrome P450 4C1-like [Danaus plexippus]|uniref:cytochrome P450 4C1-like n=1 Tax=Danaus plexippus TaxID=13037 RepID=UPI002AB0A718|nr:cytochrome P450 4C1-like [Danaus plexippus]
MIVLFLLCTLLVFTIVFRFRRRRLYELAALLPGTKSAHPVLGVIPLLIGNSEATMTSLQDFSYEIMEPGIGKGWLNHILYILVVNPEDIEMITKTCLEKDDLHRFFRRLLGYGGIFAPVSIWRRRRKILVPTFSPKILKNFVDIFAQQSNKLADKLYDKTSKTPFSIWPFLVSYNLDSVGESVMGVRLNSQNIHSYSPFLNSMTTILNITCERIFRLWWHPECLFRCFPIYSIHEKCIKLLHSFVDKVIETKAIELQKDKMSQQNECHHFDLQEFQKKSFLENLINLSGGAQNLTNDELREEILTLIVAATDTSAVAMGYTLILLGKYPKIQDKVYKELNEIFGNSNRPLESEDLNKLKYLERVIKESLRLYPPVPFIIRKIEKEIKLPSGNCLPAGSGAVLSIWGVHRNPKCWGADAEHFDPDRFLPERFKLVKSGSYLPFSIGPRNCLGYQYALMSIKTALSTILRNYKVLGEPESSPIPRIRVKMEIMMKAVDGFNVTLQKRE